jgi:hypothetical protein
VLRHWVELQADLVGKAWGFHLVSGALAELVPGFEPEENVQLRGGVAGLMQRFEALDKGLAGLLAQAAEPERGDGEPGETRGVGSEEPKAKGE